MIDLTHRVARTYLIASFLAVAVWIAFGVYVALDGDSRGNYCDFGVAEIEANFTVHGKPCRIMAGSILAVYGPVFLWVLVSLQSPAYVFYVFRIWKRSAPRPESPDGVDPAGRHEASQQGGIIRGLVHAYLAASFILLFNWAGVGAWAALDMNKDAWFCDYHAESDAANFRVQGDMCRLRVGNILGVYGTTFLIALAGVQSPAYLYLTVSHLRRRRSKMST